MSEAEREILLNQYVIMAFLHGTHLEELSFTNEATFECLRKRIDATKAILTKEGME